MRTAVGNQRVLALASWRHVVTHILEALKAAGNRPLAQDAEQLLALTEVMDSQAYAPVRPGDYGPGEARRVQQLQGLIDGVRNSARSSDRVEQAGRSSHGRIFYGWYLRSRATRKSLWFGFLPRVWAKEGISPLWMQVKISESWSRQRLAQALAPLHAAGQKGLFEGAESYYIPLPLTPYLGQRETVTDLLAQIEAIVALLDAAVGPGEESAPDDISAADQVDDDDAPL